MQPRLVQLCTGYAQDKYAQQSFKSSRLAETGRTAIHHATRFGGQNSDRWQPLGRGFPRESSAHEAPSRPQIRKENKQQAFRSVLRLVGLRQREGGRGAAPETFVRQRHRIGKPRCRTTHELTKDSVAPLVSAEASRSVARRRSPRGGNQLGFPDHSRERQSRGRWLRSAAEPQSTRLLVYCCHAHAL